MKTAIKFLVVMILPIILMSCSKSFGDGISEGIKTEMQNIKSQCPQDQGGGVVMTDANFYENEKILEYVCSIEGIEKIDDATAKIMKQAIVEALSSDVSTFEKFSIKTILNEDYRFRYIYTDVKGKKLCEIDVSKDDLK
ncbi:MAG: hypothetical protein LBE36_02795 [Flavobacteriaceae bacterium]|jgi:hypothetical protein|nr:hypothetical protein [Flavobacteriaceae bacterium]